MNIAEKLELHYLFADPSHDIDALIRNKCEAELLAVITEIALVLDIDISLLAEAAAEGGFRDLWKLLGKNGTQVTAVAAIAGILITTIPMLFDSEQELLNKDLTRLQIEETKINIEKLKKEIRDQNPESETIHKAAEHLSKNLKIIKRRSNFYSTLIGYPKVSSIGIRLLNSNYLPVSDEKIVPRQTFPKFILGSNKLKTEEIEAKIEIVSPVLKEGRYKWKGIYKDEPISFEMLDQSFKESVLFDKIPFQHGTEIICVLRIGREIDEVGEIKITGYSVPTVIEKIDNELSFETPQGKKYRHTKKLMDGQGDLFTKRPN